MRVPVNEFFAGGVSHVVNVEVSCLAFNVGVEEHLHHHVAELLAHVRKIALVQRLAGLIDFLNEIAADAFVRLRPIPRTAVGRTEIRNQPHKIAQCIRFTTFKT